MQRFRREWTAGEIVAQMSEMLERMTVIAADVSMDHYVCHGRHGSCPQCGEKWSHEHVCDVRTTPRARVYAA